MIRPSHPVAFTAADQARVLATAHLREVVVTLRDGSHVTVRPIRPEDAAPLRAGFERLSEESRYRRFLSPMQSLSGPMLRYLTELDHHDHEALVATADDGALVGVARFVRRTSDRQAAEVAVTVADDWQGRGVGTTLLELLADRARAEGISRFTALILARNQSMLALVEDLGTVRTIERTAGTIEVEITLPPNGTGPQLRKLLRDSASGCYEVVAARPESPNPSGYASR
jgi:RimJ/RimL family protein N-acetyltransferase